MRDRNDGAAVKQYEARKGGIERRDMIRTRAGAQRYNARMARIFAEGQKNNAKNAPHHAVVMLERLTEKVHRVESMHHAGGRIIAEDWAELYQLVNEARGVLENVRAALALARGEDIDGNRLGVR